MAEETNGRERFRAWVLVKADNPEEVARGFYRAERDMGENRYVVVRADIVEEGAPYNIVIPVDAASPDDLTSVVASVAKLDVKQVLILKVKDGGHNPYPPHAAHGYITEAELDREPDLRDADKLKPGRQGNSPGHSPWG